MIFNNYKYNLYKKCFNDGILDILDVDMTYLVQSLMKNTTVKHVAIDSFTDDGFNIKITYIPDQSVNVDKRNVCYLNFNQREYLNHLRDFKLGKLI